MYLERQQRQNLHGERVDGKVGYPTVELFADVLGLILRLF